MTKIDIVSGFLGAGKTTLIKKLLKEALQDTKVVLIENEFGEIGIDGGFLKEAGIEIKEMNSGCICCSLSGDFGTSLQEVLATYRPERILIEPSGVGKLSDVKKAVQDVAEKTEVRLSSATAVVDASKCRMYMKNFGEFFINQIENAGTIILSRTGKISPQKLEACVEMIREHNKDAVIITTPWEELDGNNILTAMEGGGRLEEELLKEMLANRMEEEQEGHGEHCGHHHGQEDGEHCGHHHGHGEDGEHEHGPECGCGCHSHEHGHHHADEVFASWGLETPSVYTAQEIEGMLAELEKEEEYGFVLRAKGIVPAGDGAWIYFDYVPGECDIREGKPYVTGKICVIGSKLNEDGLKKLFDKK